MFKQIQRLLIEIWAPEWFLSFEFYLFGLSSLDKKINSSSFSLELLVKFLPKRLARNVKYQVEARGSIKILKLFFCWFQ